MFPTRLHDGRGLREGQGPRAGQGLLPPPGRSLSHGEIRRLFGAYAEDNKKRRGARDAAPVAVLYGCGPRRAEAAALNLSDYGGETGELRVRGGKGRKDRITYASGGAADALEAWLGVRGVEEGPLFCIRSTRAIGCRRGG